MQVIPLVPAVRDEVDLCLLPAAGAAFAFLADFDDADVDRKPTVSELVKNNILHDTVLFVLAEVQPRVPQPDILEVDFFRR